MTEDTTLNGLFFQILMGQPAPIGRYFGRRFWQDNCDSYLCGRVDTTANGGSLFGYNTSTGWRAAAISSWVKDGIGWLAIQNFANQIF